ncbi:MAG: 3-deoxy-8-phosphooctulonate synthase [Flavobacteriales bacterium]|nr:3-deoxy-8-phosphooctulonate synthase [Flavobacteriales bacterium]|tara:strand:- start:1106 stop:1909 length:804 start_codon:yes stop_codon:yes gene_type:complete
MESINQLINSNKLFLVAGPCVIEDEQITFEIAQKIKNICKKLNISFIFKASYKKENRTKLESFRGPGLKKGMEILMHIKNKLNIPITTDFHNAEEIIQSGHLVDIIQIPAFLCRQTDILIAAAKTKKFINVKKGPFLSGESCQFIIEKIRQSGNNNIIITERGNSFGYQELVVDVRNIPIIKNFNVPVIIDATHSNQQPNQYIGRSGGRPEFIETIATACVAAGANGVFLETHPDPSTALSDGSNMLELANLECLLKKLALIKNTLN